MTNRRSACALTAMLLAAGPLRSEIQLIDGDARWIGADKVVSPPAATNATPERTEAQDTAATLSFQNGDRLHGTLVSAAPTGYGLVWRSEEAETPLAFQLRRLDRVRFPQVTVPESSSPVAQITLSNGDAVRGEIASMDGEALTLKTWYAGNITIRRAMLARIRPGLAAATAIYEGPEDMTGWVGGEGSSGTPGWSVSGGQLICSSSYSLGREIQDMPDAAEIRFTIKSDNPYVAMNIAFCNDNPRNFGGSGYMLQLSGSSGQLYRKSNDSGSRTLSSEIRLGRTGNNQPRTLAVQIFLDRTKGLLALFVNGTSAGQWTEVNGFPGKGKSLLFQSGNGMRHRIGPIAVLSWDGTLPQPGDVGERESPTDVLDLANGDKISGKLLSINAKVARLETTYAPMDIPLDRVTAMTFAKTGKQKARLNKNDIKCRFRGGGELTVDLQSLTGDRLQGSSENFGDIKLDLRAVESIKFNPWVKPPAAAATSMLDSDTGDELL